MDYQLYSQQLQQQLGLFDFRREQSQDPNLLVLRADPAKVDVNGNYEGALALLVFLRIDPQSRTVLARERGYFNNQEIPPGDPLKNTLILNTEGSFRYPVGAVMQIVRDVTHNMGYNLTETQQDIVTPPSAPGAEAVPPSMAAAGTVTPEHDKAQSDRAQEQPTSPPPAPKPDPAESVPVSPTGEQRPMPKPDASEHSPPAGFTPPAEFAPPAGYPGGGMYPPGPMKPKGKKSNKSKMILVSVIAGLVAVAIIAGVVLVLLNKDDNDSSDPEDISDTVVSELPSDTSFDPDVSDDPIPDEDDDDVIVSAGVSAEDSGNVINNQFYFDAGDKVYYSCSDSQNKEHIYSLDKESGEHKIIFDGFGWSLTVVDDWLYFTGNPGPRVDVTYNIYRIKTDGSKVEKLNDKYSMGLFFYKGHLYYLEQDIDFETSFHLIKMDVETKKKETLREYCHNALIYKDRIYMSDNSGNVMSYDMEMANPIVSIQADAKQFVISQDKIFYIDFDSNIKRCDLSGANSTTLRTNTESDFELWSLVIYNGRLYFAEHDKESFDFDSYAYDNTIRSTDFDGNNEVEIYSYKSMTTYLNIAGNRIYSFVKKRSETDSNVAAFYIESMALTGGGNHFLKS